MRCFIEGLGGASKLFAAIGVTYPVNATCTVSKGTKSLKAKDKSGLALFSIPEAGDWLVSVTDGTASREQLVSITSEGQVVTLSLSFELVLLDENGLASGYTVGEDAISPAIDVSNYTAMEISAAVTWSAASGYGVNVGLRETATGELAASVWVTGTETQTYTLDISGLNGKFFFATDYALELKEENYISSGNATGVRIGIYSITFR